MPDYQKMYALLFNAITDGLDMLKQGKSPEAENLLAAAQRAAEEMYISSE